jgi:hypothetical protein
MTVSLLYHIAAVLVAPIVFSVIITLCRGVVVERALTPQGRLLAASNA